MATRNQRIISTAFAIMLASKADPYLDAERVLREYGITDDSKLRRIFEKILIPNYERHYG